MNTLIGEAPHIPVVETVATGSIVPVTTCPSSFCRTDTAPS